VWQEEGSGSRGLPNCFSEDLSDFQNNSAKVRACLGQGEENTPSPMTYTEEHEALINRRRYQRYEIDTQLHVAMLGLEQRGTLRGRSLNISEAGIAGVFVTVWDVGTPVHLEFSVPFTKSPLRVGGVLRSHSGYRYGFEFVDLNPEQREIISKTCRTLALLQ